MTEVLAVYGTTSHAVAERRKRLQVAAVRLFN